MKIKKLNHSLKIGNWKPARPAGGLKIIFALVIFSAYFNVAEAGLIFGAPKYVGLNSGLVGYWSFNGPDMNATKALDSSGQGNHGTLTNMDVKKSTVAGKLGQALSFDGSNDYVDIVDVSASNVTLSAWIKTSSAAVQQIVAMSGAENNQFRVSLNGDIRFLANATLDYDLTASANVHDRNFHHIVAVNNGVNIYIYVDGQQIGSGAGSTNTRSWGQIGLRGAAEPFNGVIDDVRVYNRALSADEIKRLYRIGATLKIGSSLNTGSLNTGLVGYWSFNGPDMNATKALDSSGQGNHGTLTNMDVKKSTVAGKLGQALSFDGVDDYVSYSVTGPTVRNLSQYSYSAWFKLNTMPANNTYVEIWEEWNNDGTVRSRFGIENAFSSFANVANSLTWRFRDTDAATPINLNSGVNTIKAGQWYHVTVTYDSVADVQQLYLNGVLVTSGTNSMATVANTVSTGISLGSAITNSFFNGSIDDVRIYNRALSGDEIKRLYRIGATLKIGAPTYSDSLQKGLVGFWSFNGPDMNATKALDSSGQGNHGTLTNMDIKKSTVAGKLGQALNFDGVNDKVTYSSLSLGTVHSACVWSNVSDFSSDQRTIFTNESNSTLYIFYLANGGSVAYRTGTPVAVSVTFAHPINSWQHICAVRNETSVTFYTNGAQQGSTQTLSSNDSLTLSSLGNRGGSDPYQGKLDDVRIYNRALSASEIQRLYNLGR